MDKQYRIGDKKSTVMLFIVFPPSGWLAVLQFSAIRHGWKIVDIFQTKERGGKY